MAQFLESRFTVDRDGRLIMQAPMEMPRMTPEFAAQRGYKPLTQDEIRKANIKSMENGFCVMKNSRGELRAIKFSAL